MVLRAESEGITGQLASIVGSEHVTVSPEVLEEFSRDLSLQRQIKQILDPNDIGDRLCTWLPEEKT
jgi:hypothetical protein